MRKLSPYEQTHVARFGFSNIDIDAYAEMPVEYITGKVEFMDHVFTVTQDTLIPRIETEELVALAVANAKEIAQQKSTLVIADVGCGCGAIGITTLLELQKQHVPATMYMSDISEPAVEVAKQNVTTLTDGRHTQVFVSDLLKSYPQDLIIDLIAANLPYIPHDRIAVLDDSVKEYEPHVALDGGEDGLKYVKALLVEAAPHQQTGGVIILEIDYTHDHQYLATQLPLENYSLRVHFDSFSRNRFAILTRR